MTHFWPTLADFNSDPPAVTEKLVAPIIAYGGAHVLMYGVRGIGKTQLSLSLALAVANGKPWLGLYPTRQSRAAFIQLDMPHTTFFDRCQGLIDMSGNLSIVHFDRSFDICRNPKVLAELVAAKPEFTIVESLHKCHGLDENSSNTPVAVYKAWQDTFEACSFMYAHHDRKVSAAPKATGEERAMMREEAFRGSSAWIDDADLGLHIVPENAARDLADLQVRIEFTKVRSGPPQPPISVRFDAANAMMPYVHEPSAETALRIKLMQAPLSRKDAVDYLKIEHRMSQASAYRVAAKVTDLLLPETL